MMQQNMIDPTCLNAWVWKESDYALRIDWLRGESGFEKIGACDESHINSFAMLLTCLDVDCRIPTRCNSWDSCFHDYLCHDLVIILHLQSLCVLDQVRIMSKQGESAMLRAIRVFGKCYSVSSAQSISGLFALTFRIHWKAWRWISATTCRQVLSWGGCSPSNAQE